MSEFEVPEPILNSPFEEPREHRRIQPGEEPVAGPGPLLAARGAGEAALLRADDMTLMCLGRVR
jgi:hypothetical protein